LTNPPIIELVPIYRCPHCQGAPRLYVYCGPAIVRAVRYFKCKSCRYKLKVRGHVLVCGSPTSLPAAGKPR
jgi:hypothetical protein